MLNEREEEEEKKRKKKEGEVCQPRIRVYGKRLFDSIFQSPEGVLVKRSEDPLPISIEISNSSSVFFDAPPRDGGDGIYSIVGNFN